MPVPHGNSRLQIVKPIPMRQAARDAVDAYRHREALHTSRELVRRVSIDWLHELGMWRVEDEHVALVQCRACGEGARLDLDHAGVIFTAGFERQCAGLLVPRGR